MKIDPEKFRIAEDKKVNLAKWQTRIEPFYKSKDEYKSFLAQHTDELAELQELLYAHDRYSLLLIFQAMDGAGKDGAIKHVMSGINPQGCQVYSFKHPSAEELDHDFLWRAAQRLPERGRIGIFNRSYYEEVLIVRVRPEILEAQNIPEEHREHENIWDCRFRSIREFERHLHHNGTRIIKFFLHLSRDEQKKRLLDRIDQQEKNWKFDSGDLRERKLWPKYMAAYEDTFRHTSTNDCPWYIIPADDKKNARLIISRTIIETLRRLKMSYPKPTPAQLADLKARRQELLNERD